MARKSLIGSLRARSSFSCSLSGFSYSYRDACGFRGCDCSHCKHTHAHIHAYTQTRIHTYTHTHIHTYIPTEEKEGTGVDAEDECAEVREHDACAALLESHGVMHAMNKAQHETQRIDDFLLF